MLAEIGRGFSDVVVYKEKIYAQIIQLLNMASVPILTNVGLKIAGIQAELFPDPIPDLFMGAPLTISGHYYNGEFPATIELLGVQDDGKSACIEVKTRTSEVIPVKKVFIKQQLDLLTARSWLDREDKQLERKVVDLSCEESMPSAYTMMVAYETTEEAKAQASVDDPLLGAKKQPQWWKNKKVVAGLVVGNAVLIGAAAFSFGDLGASIANVPIIGALADGGLGNLVDCCGACGSCDCGGCDCSGCGDCLSC